MHAGFSDKDTPMVPTHLHMVLCVPSHLTCFTSLTYLEGETKSVLWIALNVFEKQKMCFDEMGNDIDNDT